MVWSWHGVCFQTARAYCRDYLSIIDGSMSTFRQEVRQNSKLKMYPTNARTPFLGCACMSAL